MKLDKETVLKQHFWFLLGLMAPLILVALILLWTSAAGSIAEAKQKVKESGDRLDGVAKSTPKNQKWMDALGLQEKAADQQKDKIWKQAWDTQAPFNTWPAENVFDPLRTMRFGDAISDRTCSEYQVPYKAEVEEFVNIVAPVNNQGAGQVQYKDGWEKVLTYVKPDGWVKFPPSSAELWLAQEDYWVQRELLRIIREANDSVARYRKEAAPPKPDQAKDEVDRQVFVNSDWKLDLALAKGQGNSTVHVRLTNIGRRRQVLGVVFEVHFGGTKEAEFLFIDGEPLPPTGMFEKAIALRPQVGFPESLESVVQVFDWRTVPVKRIDKIELAKAHSHRTYTRGLKPPKFLAPKEPEAKPASTTGGGGGGALNAGGIAGGLSVGGGGPGKSKGSAEKTENGLLIDRYVDVADQVRRMPVGMVLIVDQMHVQEVLTAIANSPLRIQTTQWHWQRFHGDIKPKIEESSPAPTKADKVAGGKAAQGSGVLGSKDQGAMRAKGSVDRAIADEQDWDLVELAIYGVASLYERMPAAEATAQNNPQSSQPPAGPGGAAPAKPASPGGNKGPTP
jgi:hypothetical protein